MTGEQLIGVKICGLSDAPGFDAAIAHGADWVGFVFFARSPRAVSPAQAAALSARHPGGAGRIGLFVRPTDEEIAGCLDQVRLDGLQIYDSEGRARDIGQRFGLPVWLACAISSRVDLPGGSCPDGSIDRLVIESRPPMRSDRPGGNGIALDWTMLRGWRAPRPWLLAGGLDPANIGEAIRQSGAAAVDVSSGVETSPGVKDPERIAAFIQAARNAGKSASAA
jgi:phosphoribosylanthranilate isomerase